MGSSTGVLEDALSPLLEAALGLHGHQQLLGLFREYMNHQVGQLIEGDGASF